MGRSTIEVFDLYAEDYDKWFDTPEGRVLFQMEIEAVRLLMKNLEIPFLEIGVGTGRFAEKLGIDFGVDPSQRSLEMAERRGININRAKGEKLPFEKESFGGVFILFTLCFVNDPERVISEAKRVLKKGGGLIIGMINRESLWGKFYMKKRSEGHPIYKYARFYSATEIVKMLEGVGMKIEGYSSTLCQPPSETPHKEPVHNEFIENAGFVCILARKYTSFCHSLTPLCHSPN